MSGTPDIIQNLSTDTVIFGYENYQLKILLIERKNDPCKGMYALPGGFVLKNEELQLAADRVLMEHTGMQNVYLEQVHTFGELDRFPTKRVITIAYFALVKTEDYSLVPGIEVSEANWFPVTQMPELPFDHQRIFEFCLEKLQQRIRVEPVGINLLPSKFSLTEFHKMYEAILQQDLDKRNFRKKLLKMNLLLDLNEKQQNVSHRAAKLYKFDEENYQKLLKKGFNFDM